jgi:hypothetical protein
VANFITKSLFGRLSAIFLAVTIVPLAVVGFLSFFGGRDTTQDQQFRMLSAVRETMAHEVNGFLDNSISIAKFLSVATWGASQGPFRRIRPNLYEVVRPIDCGVGAVLS